MTTEDVNKIFEIKKLSDQYRSKVISAAISFELMISQILVDFFGFSKEVKESIKTYLFSDTLTFEKKINLFNSLHKKNIFIDNTKQVRADLNYLIKIRNYMAHSELTLNPEEIKNHDSNCFQFISFSDRKGEEVITVFIKNPKDNPAKNEYSYEVFKSKLNLLSEKLGLIYDNIEKE